MRKHSYFLLILLLGMGLVACGDDKEIIEPVEPAKPIIPFEPFDDIMAVVDDQNISYYFQKWISDKYWDEYDTEEPFHIFSSKEIAKVRKLEFNNFTFSPIDNLSILKYFIGLERFICWNFSTLTPKLDLRNNTKLKQLYLNRADIKEIDLSKNVLLSSLEISGANIETFNINSYSYLEEARLDFNDLLKQVDMSENESLKKLTVKSLPKLEVLRVDDCKKLQFLDIQECNSIKDFTLKGCENMEMATIRDNDNLQHIDLGKNQTKLRYLHLDNNSLFEVDLSFFPDLQTLRIRGNPIVELDISKNKHLAFLYVDEKLQTLYVWKGFEKPEHGFDIPQSVQIIEKK